ncbi:MAG: hypothetical protein ACU0AU_04800 [Cognatishimia activa]
MSDKISSLEARVKALSHFLFCFSILALFNFGVALWYFQQKSTPDWNFISVTLTIFEILLAIALVGGFWMLRGAAEEAAAKEASEVAKKVVEETARETVREWLEFRQNLLPPEHSSETDLTDMINSLGKPDDGGADAK